jgi:hypothetical protein
MGRQAGFAVDSFKPTWNTGSIILQAQSRVSWQLVENLGTTLTASYFYRSVFIFQARAIPLWSTSSDAVRILVRGRPNDRTDDRAARPGLPHVSVVGVSQWLGINPIAEVRVS